MSKQENYTDKFPFLHGLVVSDNNFYYLDEHGNQKKVDPKEIIQKVKELKKNVDNNQQSALH